MNLQMFDSFFNYFRDDKNLIDVNVYHDEHSYTIEFYIAGINKKDINLFHEHDTLFLEITNHEFPTLDVIKREFKGYIPTRTITLNDVNFKEAKTNYCNGKLVVNIPKKCCERKQNNISIE